MKQIEHRSTKEPLGPFWAALALILLGLVLGGWHLLLTGIDENFGIGVAVGAILAFGMIFLLSKTARNLR